MSRRKHVFECTYILAHRYNSTGLLIQKELSLISKWVSRGSDFVVDFRIKKLIPFFLYIYYVILGCGSGLLNVI